MDLTPDQAWIDRALGKERAYLRLSILGVLVGVGLAIFYGVQWTRHDDYPLGLRFVVVVLILLNARQNLRQFLYCRALRRAPSSR